MAKCFECQTEVSSYWNLGYHNHKYGQLIPCMSCFATTDHLINFVLIDERLRDTISTMTKEKYMCSLVNIIHEWLYARHQKKWNQEHITQVMVEFEEMIKFHDQRLKTIKPELKDTHHYNKGELRVLAKEYKKHVHLLKKTHFVMGYLKLHFSIKL
jgi:hypothetical protein